MPICGYNEQKDGNELWFLLKRLVGWLVGV